MPPAPPRPTEIAKPPLALARMAAQFCIYYFYEKENESRLRLTPLFGWIGFLRGRWDISAGLKRAVSPFVREEGRECILHAHRQRRSTAMLPGDRI